MRTRKRNLGYCGLIALLFGIGRIAQWKWTRKLRVRQAAATPHSKNWQQSIGWHKKEFIGQTWVADQIESSSSKEKEENCKIGSSKRKRYSQTGGRQDTRSSELILSLDELDYRQLKAFSHRNRAAESVNEVSEEKKLPCRGRRINPKCDVKVRVEENAVAIDVN